MYNVFLRYALRFFVKKIVCLILSFGFAIRIIGFLLVYAKIRFICEKCYNFHGLFLRFTARRIITYYRFYDVSVVVVVYFKGNASLLMTYLFHHVVEGIVGYVIVMSFYFVNGFIPLGCR